MAKLLVRLNDHSRANSSRMVWQEGDVISVHPDSWTPAGSRGKFYSEQGQIAAGRFALINLPGEPPRDFIHLLQPEIGVEEGGEPGMIGRRAEQINILLFSAGDIAKMRAGDEVSTDKATLNGRVRTRGVR